MKIVSAKEVSRVDKCRVVLYSKPGVGKTTALRHLKGKVLVFDLDHSSKVLSGEEHIDIVSLDRNDPQNSMKEFLQWVPTIIKDYDYLVIDNFSSFEKDWFRWRGKSTKSGINNELQDYSAWTNYFLEVVSRIYALPINIVVTTWEGNHNLTLENGQIVSQYMPDIRQNVINTFMGLTDVVGRVVINPETGNRGVYLEGSDSQYCKNRLDNRKVCKIEDLFNFGDVPA